MFRERKNEGGPEVNPDWVPPSDQVFQYLMREAALGSVPVYYAEIPLTRLKRFAPTFHPEKTKDGEKVVTAIMADWRAGQFARMWVYPKGELFIVSDDYFTLAAGESGDPDYMPCWVLGMAPKGAAKNVQGPIDQKEIRKMLGLSDG